MRPEIENLDHLFAEVKEKGVSPTSFFEELWLTGGGFPQHILHLVDSLYEHIQSQTPVNRKDLATALLAKGFVRFHFGKLEESLQNIAESRKLFSEIKDDAGYQCATVMFGGLYRTFGEVELAVQYLFQAYEHMSKTGGHKIFLIFCTYNLAEIYSETGQYEEALRFHQLNVKASEEIGNRNILCRAVSGLGLVYLRQKKFSMAMEYLTEGLKLAEEMNNEAVKARALTDLGSYYFEMGDYETAIAHHRQALQLRNDLKIPNGAVTNMIHLAEIFVKQNKPGEAIDILSKALRIAEEIKVKPKIFQIHLALSDIYQSKGDLAKSLFHYKAYQQIREEVQHEDNVKKIKNQKMIFEAEQTRKENIIIKKQKEEIQQKNIELQETIDELTLARVSRKARAFTLAIGIGLFIIEDTILHFVLHWVSTENFFLSLTIKGVIIFSLKPIDEAIEHYLLKRVIKNRRPKQVVVSETEAVAS
jgi:tetratricopeptide (TPR) repeat protein